MIDQIACLRMRMESVTRIVFALMKLGMLVAVLLGALVGCDEGEPATSEALQLKDGKHFIDVSERAWEGITRVWYYRPPSAREPLRVVMVIHGSGRNGEDYLDSWVPLADENRLLVVAPEFGEERLIGFVGSLSSAGVEWRFTTGNVVSWFGRDVAEDHWYFTSIERLFDAFLQSDPHLLDRYVLFGHSAGGQFVHRMVMFKPNARFNLHPASVV